MGVCYLLFDIIYHETMMPVFAAETPCSRPRTIKEIQLKSFDHTSIKLQLDEIGSSVFLAKINYFLLLFVFPWVSSSTAPSPPLPRSSSFTSSSSTSANMVGSGCSSRMLEQK